MKILLVLPGRGQIIDNKGSRSLLPPSPLLEVAGMTSKDEHEVRIWDELAQGQISAETLDWAEIVGISGLSTSHFGALRVAELARSRNKRVIGGGMHVTGLYQEKGGPRTLTEHYDAVVVGRLTSHLWSQILWDAEDNRLSRVYQADHSDSWEFVVPRYDLVDFKYYYFPALRSSAGCSYGCDFCTVNLVCGKLETKPYEILKPELELLPEIKVLPGIKMPLVDCADSFGVDYRHTLEVVLPLYLVSGRRWFTEITIRNLMGVGNDREPLIGPMADAGCMAVYIGVESILKRACAKSPERRIVEQAIKAAHQAGLVVMGSIILDITGEETEASIKETVEWTIDQGLDLVQYSLLAALPGSRIRQEALAKGELIELNPERYCGAYATVKHRNLSPEKRIELLRYAYYRTYSFEGVSKRILGHTNRPLNLFANTVVRQSAHRWWG